MESEPVFVAVAVAEDDIGRELSHDRLCGLVHEMDSIDVVRLGKCVSSGESEQKCQWVLLRN